MKNLFFAFILIISIVGIASAQTPQAINYQAVARNSSGAQLTNQTIKVKISIIQDSAKGAVVYSELHNSIVTNQFGLFTLEIGKGSSPSSNFNNINWASKAKFLKVELDPTGSSGFSDMGTTQLLSVPYSLYAESSGGGVKSINDLNDVNSTGATSGQVLKWNGSNWIPGTDNTSSSSGGVNVSPRLSGDGTLSTPLDVAQQGASSGQVLKWSGTNWMPAADNSNTYLAGTGLLLTGNTFSNNAPDQTVTFISGNGISVTGSYPNFTIANTIATGANTSLSNLTATSINQVLLPSADNTLDFGSAAKSWKNIYLDGSVYMVGSRILNSSGSENIFAGADAGLANTSGFNAFFGAFSGDKNTSGYSNSFFGNRSGYTNTTGILNTFVGKDAGFFNTIANGNTAVGASALRLTNKGGDNTTVGFNGMYYNTTGSSNTTLGVHSLENNTSGSFNVAIGSYALFNSIDRNYNIAIGDSTLYNNGAGSFNSNSGSNNIAMGYKSMFGNTIGNSNVALGQLCMVGNTYGTYNVALGASSMYTNTTGSDNVAIGIDALGANTTGSNNIGIGAGSGFSTQISDYCISIGDNAGQSISGAFTNSVAIGKNSRITGSNTIRLGDATVTSIGGQVGWSSLSDGRFKKNIQQNVKGLEFINQLKPITYTIDVNGLNKYLNVTEKSYDGITAKEQIVYSGFIAQDVQAVAKSVGYDFSGVDAPKNENDLYGLRYGDFVVPLVKAVQELSAENNLLKMTNENLMAEVGNMKQQIQEMDAALSTYIPAYGESKKKLTANK